MALDKALRNTRRPPLGTGQRFARLKSELAGRKGVRDPGALAAYIGAKRYSRARMQKWAAKGRR